MAELSTVADTRRCSTIRAPIDTLPNELLSDIFTMGAASQPLDVNQLPFPLLVSSISRHWREAAISSPPLWNQLSFTANPRSYSWCADLFLPRSGAYPLDIIISLPPDGYRSMDQVFQIILPHHERWRKLRVRARDNIELLRVRGAILDIAVPLLKNLELLYKFDCPYHTPFFIPGAPVLTSVKLRGLWLLGVPPLANLTSLQLASRAHVTQSEMENIVAASPALRVLRLRLEGFEASGSGSVNLNIPSLRELSLNFLD